MGTRRLSRQIAKRPLPQVLHVAQRIAQRDFTMLLRAIESEQKQTQLDYFMTLANYMADSERELARCAALGIEPPEMVPHPNDIVIDPKWGTAEVLGPFSSEEKKQWDFTLGRGLIMAQA